MRINEKRSIVKINLFHHFLEFFAAALCALAAKLFFDTVPPEFLAVEL